MKAILMFSGFQESEERQSGFERGFFQTVRKFSCKNVTVYHPRTWKTNVKNLLRQLYENGITEVAIISYSHGQAAALDFARTANKYGVTVAMLIACDPIYRPTWAPRNLFGQIFAIRAVVGSPVIRVPATVREVFSVVQTITLPSGHKFVAEDETKTQIHSPLEAYLPHTRIDESPVFWNLVAEKLPIFVS